MSKPKTINKLFALQSALRNRRLSPGTDALVLSILIEYQNPAQGYSWPSIETVAAVAGLKERATRMSIRRLEDADYIQTRLGGGRNKTSRYRVCLERFDEAPLKEPIQIAAKRRHDNAGFETASVPKSNSENRHRDAETRHDDDAKPGTTMPPKPSYGAQPTKKPSAGAASNSSSTRHRNTPAADLRKVEAALKSARQEGRSFPADNMVNVYRWLRTVAGEDDDYTCGDPIAGWAHRLSEELIAFMDRETFARAAA
ncbi:helix-turn-helix domain-containing protein [Mesorhizobium sp. B2-4-14]|uniref:helix-turn-helix domain-containing protein n=1 Tax=Mesorhizobium sp. B2-4-14 TaxID=2589935 RepID=UPI00112C96DA|nr:helix-turn-helix domain-containing protein [Mesorhizobium sp. B2-4-14]TPK98875.1 helix-turn-helix domain-containing protein [Mesorhizobium sp. B2-4-14]